MSVPLIVLLSIAGYFALLFIIAWLVGRSKEGGNFYGGRKTCCDYTVGFDLILINAALTCAGLLLLVKKAQDPRPVA